jgi:hypothetical protein
MSQSYNKLIKSPETIGKEFIKKTLRELGLCGTT